MKIAVVWNAPRPLTRCSVRFERYASGFERLGHRAVVVCHPGCEEGFPAPTTTIPADRFADPEAWRQLGCDVAVVVTWHRMSEVLRAMQDAGVRTVALTDSDGQLGTRAHPWITLQRMWVYQRSLRGRIRCLRYWLRQLRTPFPDEEREYLESSRSSDLIVLGSAVAEQRFARFLRSRRTERLMARVVSLPFCIGEAFTRCPLPETRADRFVAVGRWDDPQKNPALLAAALRRFRAHRQRTEIHVFGPGGASRFGGPDRPAGVSYRGEIDQAGLAVELASSRAIVFSSRWEGSPHAANEALATGGTLVGTPIPSLSSWSQEGRFGTVSSRHTPGSLAAALLHEAELWDDGHRDAMAIADHWRRALDPETICGRMLEELERLG